MENEKKNMGNNVKIENKLLWTCLNYQFIVNNHILPSANKLT